MAYLPEVLIHQDYWNDHLVEIRDSGQYRSLYFASSVLQSRMSLARPYELVLPYTQYMLLTLLIRPKPTKILIVGIGSGSLIRFFHHHFPQCYIDAVDYSQHIIDVARGYFQLPASKEITIHCGDGYQFLKNCRKSDYDLILVDAFDDQGMAPTIYSDHFFRLCADNISQNGIVSCNTWSSDGKQLRKIKIILEKYFESQLSLPVLNRGNIIVISLPDQIPWAKICQKKKELKKISQKFGLNFKEIVKVTKQNNMTLSRKISSLLA